MLNAKPINTTRILHCAKARLFDIKAINIPGVIAQMEAPAIGGITTLNPAIVNCIIINVTTTPSRFSIIPGVIDLNHAVKEKEDDLPVLSTDKF